MSKRRNKKTYCLNCDYSFNKEENYCPNCSQENHDLKIPFRHFVEEFLEGLFHFDSKMWLSLKTLFFYPGKITNDFLEGKRVRFVPPIRLYVFFSFIFFFLLNIVTHVDEKEKDIKVIDIIKEKSKQDTANKISNLDSVQYLIEQDTTMSKSEIAFFKNFKKVMNLNKEQLSNLNQTIYKYMSYALFLLLPIFALIMKLIYYRSHKFYYEHLIAAIHYHIIIFIILILSIPIFVLHLPFWLILILIFATYVYFVFSLKVVFKQGLGKSILKATLIFLLYGIILSITTLICTLIVSYNYFK